MAWRPCSSPVRDRLRPHRQLVPARVAEVKPTPTGKVKGWLRDLSTCRRHGGGDSVQVGGVQHDEGTTRRGGFPPPEPAAQPAIHKTRVLRTVVGERPAED